MSYIKRRKAGKKGPTPQEILADQRTFLDWANENANTIVYAAGAVLLILFVVLGVTWVKSEKKESAGQALSSALAVYQNALSRERSGDPELTRSFLEQAMSAFGQVSSDYGDMLQGQSASLYRAGILYRLGRYEEAAAAVEELSGRNPDLVAEVNGSYLLARSYEALGEYNQAVGVYSQLRDRNEGEMKAVLGIDIARCQEISGNRDAAIDIYREILSAYPDSIFALRAEKKLATLGVLEKGTL